MNPRRARALTRPLDRAEPLPRDLFDVRTHKTGVRIKTALAVDR